MQSNSPSLASIRGTIQAIRFHNPENGFTIARVRLDDGISVVHISGHLFGSCVGERVEAEGIWVKHSPNGWHLEVRGFALLPFTDPSDLETYFASGVIEGITPELTTNLVQTFGLDTIRIIEETPARLKEVKGFTARRIQQVQASWSARQRWNQLRVLLQGGGIPRAVSRHIYQTYGQKGFRTPKEWERLISELYTLDFASAEQIAKLFGVKTKMPKRVEQGIRHVLKQWNEDGHVLAKSAELIRESAQLLNVSEKLVQKSLRRLANTRELILEKERVYRPELYNAEVGVAQRLLEIQAHRKSRLAEFHDTDWSKAFNWLAFNSQIVLTREQQNAVKTALTAQVSILTGGPGTGKTTTVRAIVALLKKRGYSFLLAAPTARAAKRLSEASGAPAQTLHRLLQFKPAAHNKNLETTSKTKFARGLAQPLSADLIIVDECSMLDLSLMNDLLQSVKPTSHILFVGDPHQLPSIGAGKVLQDLIDSRSLPVTPLNTVMRQAKNSLIVANAHRIQHGELPIQLPHARDFLVIGEREPKRAVRHIVNLVTTQLPMRFGFDSLEDIQVLCPMNQGPASVAALNTALQAALNPPHPNKAEWQQPTRILRVGDKVAQTRNDYTRGVFNGDIGRIVWMDVAKQCLSVEFTEQRVDYAFSELDQLVHAFAMTVHKAQGCEYRAVVILMLGSHGKLLQRNLLYTALTRARELTVIVGTQQAIARAVHNNRLAQRYSHLAPRLAQGIIKSPNGVHKPKRKRR